MLAIKSLSEVGLSVGENQAWVKKVVAEARFAGALAEKKKMSEEKKYHCEQEKERREIFAAFIEKHNYFLLGVPIDDKAVLTTITTNPDICFYCGKVLVKKDKQG